MPNITPEQARRWCRVPIATVTKVVTLEDGSTKTETHWCREKTAKGVVETLEDGSVFRLEQVQPGLLKLVECVSEPAPVGKE